MKKLPLFLSILFALAKGMTGELAAQNTSLDKLVKIEEPKVVEWRRDFHEHPELSNREFGTSKKVADHLRS